MTHSRLYSGIPWTIVNKYLSWTVILSTIHPIESVYMCKTKRKRQQPDTPYDAPNSPEALKAEKAALEMMAETFKGTPSEEMYREMADRIIVDE